MTITILGALVVSADEKTENNFYTRFYNDVLFPFSKCQNFTCFAVFTG